MDTLSELQTFLLGAIVAPEPPRATGVIADGPHLDAGARLAIYRHAYVARLTEVLRDDYPVLAEALGEARFAAVCRTYIARHPSRSPNLNAWGRHMADLCANLPLLENQSPFVAELAALEWALVEVIHAEAAPPLDPSELARIPADAWGHAHLVASDALRLLSFRYPVNAYYKAARSGERPATLPEPAPSATAVYRRDTTLWRMDLTAPMERVLSALVQGEPIAQALTRVGEVANAERSVMIWFREWVQAGFFARVDY